MDNLEKLIVLAGGRITCLRCTARAKHSKDQCRYKHGEQTLEAKAARSAKDAEMQALEDIMHVMNMTSAKRTRGRKAIGYVPIKTFEEARRWIYLDMLKKHEAENSAKT
jgi:hypothetical protein